VVLGEIAVGLLEQAGGRLRRGRQLVRGAEALHELSRGEIDLIPECLVAKVDIERDHRDAKPLKDIRRQVGGAVGDDGYAW
jgi:hypothetical protein